MLTVAISRDKLACDSVDWQWGQIRAARGAGAKAREFSCGGGPNSGVALPEAAVLIGPDPGRFDNHD